MAPIPAMTMGMRDFMRSSGFAMPQTAIPSAALAVPYAAPMAVGRVEVGLVVVGMTNKDLDLRK